MTSFRFYFLCGISLLLSTTWASGHVRLRTQLSDRTLQKISPYLTTLDQNAGISNRPKPVRTHLPGKLAITSESMNEFFMGPPAQQNMSASTARNADILSLSRHSDEMTFDAPNKCQGILSGCYPVAIAGGIGGLAASMTTGAVAWPAFLGACAGGCIGTGVNAFVVRPSAERALRRQQQAKFLLDFSQRSNDIPDMLSDITRLNDQRVQDLLEDSRHAARGVSASSSASPASPSRVELLPINRSSPGMPYSSTGSFFREPPADAVRLSFENNTKAVVPIKEIQKLAVTLLANRHVADQGISGFFNRMRRKHRRYQDLHNSHLFDTTDGSRRSMAIRSVVEELLADWEDVQTNISEVLGEYSWWTKKFRSSDTIPLREGSESFTRLKDLKQVKQHVKKVVQELQQYRDSLVY